VNRDLSKQFAKFAGKEVRVDEVPYISRSGKARVHLKLDENDSTVISLKEEVAKTGLHLRLLLSNQMGTCDFQMGRVTARITKEADGKYRIGPTFNLG
jgi:hypothetical protein